MKQFLFALTIFYTGFLLNAQQVSNVHFEQVDKQIHIYYDLEGEGTYNISVYCSEDDGDSYGNALIYITGAVGENQKPDNDKLIIWDVLEEKGKLLGAVLFKVEALYLVNLKNGKSIYDGSCIACHWKGVAGAAALYDTHRWEEIAAKGIKVLFQQSIDGYQGRYGVMPAKGTCTDCSNQDIFDAVGYMLYRADVFTKWELYRVDQQEIFDTSKLSIMNGVFTDERDKQIYNWVKIGKQVWMAENLSYKTSTGSWAYDDDENNVATCGRLYDWKTAIEACPEGWHLSTDDEWKTLEMYLGMSQSEANGTGSRGTDEGKKLKSTTGWILNTCTDAVDFSALPGSDRFPDGGFYGLGYNGKWWSATANGSTDAWCRSLDPEDDGVYRYNSYKDYGFSVRCVRD